MVSANVRMTSYRWRSGATTAQATADSVAGVRPSYLPLEGLHNNKQYQ